MHSYDNGTSLPSRQGNWSQLQRVSECFILSAALNFNSLLTISCLSVQYEKMGIGLNSRKFDAEILLFYLFLIYLSIYLNLSVYFLFLFCELVHYLFNIIKIIFHLRHVMRCYFSS